MKKQETMTRRRKQILRFVRSFRRGRGYPPSIREIADSFGLTSNSTVHAHLKNLERDGYLVRYPRRPRSVCLTTKGEALLSEAPIREEWPRVAKQEVDNLKRLLAAHLNILNRLPWEVVATHCPEAEFLLAGRGPGKRHR